MQRDISALQGREFDLVIVGGGIFGLCAAWDATLRGLSVALLERWDFAHAASTNCFKMIHGGIRYLQHGDLVRLRQSVRERSAFLRIAPHLARPLPIFMPTYGHGMQGREILMAGMKVYDLLTLDRNRGISDPARRIPPTHSVSRAGALDLFPDLVKDGLSGGAMFHDGQMYSTARLALCFLLSAVERGAAASNYTEVTRFLEAGERVVGVSARDTLTDAEIEVRGRVVLNASGGWAPKLLAAGGGKGLQPAPTFSRDACFLVRRPFPSRYALAVAGSTKDPDAVVSRDARHLFLVPWRDCTLVGVWHGVYDQDPAQASVSQDELSLWIDEINQAYPAADLSLEDVALIHCGLVLFGENAAGAEDLSYGKRSLLVDHASYEGREGLVTLIGVRYTTARVEARHAVDLAYRKLGHRAPPCRTETTPIYGGEMDCFEAELERARAMAGGGISPRSIEALVSNHGSAFDRVLRLAEESPRLLGSLPGSDTLAAEVVHAVRTEMAVKLSDVVFRRTDLGTAGHPGAAALEAAADLMAEELHWDANRRQKELDDTCAAFPALT